MRTIFLTLLMCLLPASMLLAEEPALPPEDGGEEKPKTEEEILWEKIWEALTPLKTVMEIEDIDQQDRVWAEARENLAALGKKTIPHLETLLPKYNEKGVPVPSQKLKEFLERDSTYEVESLIERVMRKFRWVSEKEKVKREELLKELRDKESEAENLSFQFAELGWFGVAGLKEEYATTADDKVKEKVLDILGDMARQGLVPCVPFLLDLLVDVKEDIRSAAMKDLAEIAETAAYGSKEEFDALDKVLVEESAYEMVVGALRFDSSTDVRYYAARVLRWMEVRRAAQELSKALDDKNNRVSGEAADALLRIAGDGVKDPGPGKWDTLVRSLKSWVSRSQSSLGKQLKAAKPVRKPRKEDDEEEEKEKGD